MSWSHDGCYTMSHDNMKIECYCQVKKDENLYWNLISGKRWIPHLTIRWYLLRGRFLRSKCLAFSSSRTSASLSPLSSWSSPSTTLSSTWSENPRCFSVKLDQKSLLQVQAQICQCFVSDDPHWPLVQQHLLCCFEGKVSTKPNSPFYKSPVQVVRAYEAWSDVYGENQVAQYDQ